MCRPCCEYHLIQCRCPSKGSKVGYTVPCCRNAADQCDPCIIHPGCSLFENCKTCHNGTWRANDDFFVNGKYCAECRQGWSGGDCKTCGGVIQRTQGHIALESYPTNARCEWTVEMGRGSSIELSFSRLSLESDHNCRYDYVEVRDGDDLSSPVIGRFCGDQLPPPVKSSGNFLHILFTSDGYNNFDGFVITFQESSASTTKNTACGLPGEPTNGYLLPVYGPEEELAFVNYWCHPPFMLTGAQQRTCLPNGTWSGTVPSCVKARTSPVRCAPPLKLLHGYHRPALDAVGGAETVEFFCKNSYMLSGNHKSSCLSNGSWSSRPPKCVRACREPKVSELVRQSVVKPHVLSRESSDHRRFSSRYQMHDLLSAGFMPLLLDKQSDAERDDGAVGAIPQGFHPVYTSIDYKCASPLYRHIGSSRRTCLKTGRWSGHHVSCSPVCGKFDTFGRHNLSHTQWPWHVAIYVRSPPDHAASSHGSRGRTVSDQRGASEESSFWVLACSGALVGQRRVLAAAQCVVDKDKRRALHAAHVKVVAQQQTSRERLRNQHHLKVSEISVHSDFYSAPDSDVAVLKLKDKAKISERVLPVCLPNKKGGEVTAREAFTVRWTLPGNHEHLSRHATASRTELVELSDVAQCERAFAQGGAHTAAVSDNRLCVISKPASSPSPCRGVVPGITAVFSSTGGSGPVGEPPAQPGSCLV
ncbi:inactive serine protease PAMR1 [Brachyistius frenatus]|uniref:inactive serine protease PAMR1 n=1 Tax=Brachyistius frenatus TaxID=100188 RepID=UPI0037E781F0